MICWFSLAKLLHAVIILVNNLRNSNHLLGLVILRLFCLSDPTLLIAIVLINCTDFSQLILMNELVLFCIFLELLFETCLILAHFSDMRVYVLFFTSYPALIYSLPHLFTTFTLRQCHFCAIHQPTLILKVLNVPPDLQMLAQLFHLHLQQALLQRLRLTVQLFYPSLRPF
jgi:hypothetical protein